MNVPVRVFFGRIVLTGLFVLCISCRSVSPGPEEPVPVTAPREESPTTFEEDLSPVREEAPPEAEIPSEIVPAASPAEEAPEHGDLPEPEADLAEVNLPDSSPDEETGIGALPEPVPPESGLFPGAEAAPEPDLSPEVEPEPLPPLPPVEPTPEPLPPPQPVEPPPEPLPPLPPVEPPPEPLPPPQPVEPEPVPPPLPVEPEPEPLPPPQPPRSLRPAEPLPPPPPARERPPVPVNPVPNLPARPAPQPPVEAEGDVTFSRVIRAAAGQLVEIPFRGTGWVFLGELGSRRGIAYGSRRLDPEGQSFIFRAEEPGTYALKFYKQDFIRDSILNDYVRVIVTEAPESTGTATAAQGRVIAQPRWPPLPGEAAAVRDADASGETGLPPVAAPAPSPGTRPPAETQPGAPVRGPEPAAPPPAADGQIPERGGLPPVEEPSLSGTSVEEYLGKVREEYDAGRIPSALSILDQFREAYPAGSDEAWWLYGQLLEANSPRRDIRSALEYYRRLIQEYPQSSRYDEARRRIAYLERFYFNIQ